MRLFQELIEQPEFVHQLKSGRMDGVATEIAVEIGVLFQDCHGQASPREQITSHHTGRSAADDHAASLEFLRLIHWHAVLISISYCVTSTPACAKVALTSKAGIREKDS